MISADFAPNESLSDAWISLKLLFQPWRWKRGNEIKEVKKKILQNLQLVSSIKHQVSLFLTARSALYHLLQSLNLSANDEIIVQGFTCEAVILPILANNLTPVYVDIESQTFSFNPIELQKKITDKTKVVVLQHTFGLTPINRSKVLSLIRKHKLLLIEDIAHGYNQVFIDGLKHDEIEDHHLLMSFGRSKALSSVFGGAIITNQTDVAIKLQRVENTLQYPSLLFILRLLVYKPLSVFIKNTYNLGIGKLVHKTIQALKFLIPEITQKEKDGAYDFLLDKAYPNALAVLLLTQLDTYEQIQENRALICSLYNKNLSSSIKHLTSSFSLLRYPLLVDNPELLRKKAAKRNIFLGNWYNQVVAPKSISLKKMKYRRGMCPKAEELSQKIVNLPTNITYHEALKVINLVHEYSGDNK
jgi:dTDP-4-amino-4,6-dideoxygalactose transaminase